MTYVGADGAGHFVKMVHNGIEYADMQLIAESYDLLRHACGLEVAEIGKRFEAWNETELESFLIEITARVLAKTDERTGQPLVDVILDAAGQKGTGRWTAQNALELGVPLTGITEAVYARSLSALKSERVHAAEILKGPTGGADPSLADDLSHALYASKIVAYAQGFQQMAAAAQDEGWKLDLGAMATIWRGGCIIRARFLDRIREAYDAEPGLANLMLADFFSEALERAQDPWRRVVARSAELGIPTPAFSSSLAYYDGYRRAAGPASLIQGLRDLFGAHTYQRLDGEGTFHTIWEKTAGRSSRADLVTFRRSRSSTGYTHLRFPGGPTWLTPPPYRCTLNHRRRCCRRRAASWCSRCCARSGSSISSTRRSSTSRCRRSALPAFLTVACSGCPALIC